MSQCADEKLRWLNLNAQPEIGRQLSLIDIQISLRTYLLSLFPSTARSSRSISKHLGPILTRLSHRPGPESGSAFLALFYNLAERVIGGEAVDLEGMLDLLTLKDNVGREDDGVDALRVLVLDRVSFYLFEGLGSKTMFGGD